MTKNIFYLIALVVGLILTRTAGATEPMQMTMTLQPDGKVIIDMAGTGMVTIDWGDGSKNKTHYLSLYDEDDWQIDWREKQPKYRLSHKYSRRTGITRNIIITGENITHLECGSLGLTSLDVRKNTALTDLWCYDNKLTSLDITSNIALTNLSCSENQLTSLDVSKNPTLKYLWCFDNQLTRLDVSNNVVLRGLYCYGNQLTSLDMSWNSELIMLDCCSNNISTNALNDLFGMLKTNVKSEKKLINIGYNPGTDACIPTIATDKGWVVISPTWVEVPVGEEFQSLSETEEEKLVIVDKPPLFKRRSPEIGFRRYVFYKTVYPKYAEKNGIEGRIFVDFTINRQGEVVHAKVRQGAHPLLKDEALRVVYSSPKWTPAMQRGKKVKVSYTFPFVFRLK